MEKYIFNIVQNFGGYIDDQNVWTVASTKEEAYCHIESEYHNLVDITLIRVYDYED